MKHSQYLRFTHRVPGLPSEGCSTTTDPEKRNERNRASRRRHWRRTRWPSSSPASRPPRRRGGGRPDPPTHPPGATGRGRGGPDKGRPTWPRWPERETASDGLSPTQAVELLGTMLGGYNVPVLVELLDSPELGVRWRRRHWAAPSWSSTPSTMWPRWRHGGNPARRLSPAIVGGRRLVHRPARCARGASSDRVPGGWRDQHRRPLPRHRGLVPGRHPPSRPLACWPTGPTSTIPSAGSPS